jgi:hypothetical protein
MTDNFTGGQSCSGHVKHISQKPAFELFIQLFKFFTKSKYQDNSQNKTRNKRKDNDRESFSVFFVSLKLDNG